jgi:hypothetical protein
MRLLLFILGVFATVVCIEKPAVAQNYPWCAITISGRTVSGAAGSQHCNNAWTTCVGLAGTVDLVHTLHRRYHIH